MYCNEHRANNCLECAIRSAADRIVNEMRTIEERRRWFNIGFGKVGRFKLFNLFNRHTNTGEHWWGFGFCQYGNRHLFYIGHSGVSIMFIGRTP